MAKRKFKVGDKVRVRELAPGGMDNCSGLMVGQFNTVVKVVGFSGYDYIIDHDAGEHPYSRDGGYWVGWEQLELVEE